MTNHSGSAFDVADVVIADEHGDVFVLGTISAAEKYLEPTDIRNGEYSLYSGLGRRLIPIVYADQYGSERIRIDQESQFESNHTVEVRRLLIRLLTLVGSDPAKVEVMTLPELVEESLKFKSA